ncbi:MAG: NUDIX domain-containing protein [Gemmatimonadetes bacterium]|nr:NUDIX domain-containing protein [Gemmatimonadota bacterium]
MQSGGNVSVRAVFLTEYGKVLLMKVAGEQESLWIMPGGRIRAGEDAQTALAREIGEETGLPDFRVESEVWIRHGSFVRKGERHEEVERFFLIPTERFEPSIEGMEDAEKKRFRRYEWWNIGDIVDSDETFVPRRLGRLLLKLHAGDVPPKPVETGE